MVETNAKVWVRELEFNNGDKYSFLNDDIVIFVGANNVGKSKVLKEIKDRMINSINYSSNPVILNTVSFGNNFTKDNLLSYFMNNFKADSNGHYSIQLEDGSGYSITSYNFERYKEDVDYFYKAFYFMLSTENRLTLTRPVDFNGMGDRNSLKIYEKLRTSESYLRKLNFFLKASFNKCIDVSGSFSGAYYSNNYKIGSKEEIEDTISSPTRVSSVKLEELDNLHEQGDGIRSAVGILASLIVNDQSVFLIDEPEAFLHPPQARLLGSEIVELSKGKQCFISTHNIDLIRGLLDTKSSRIKIIKINREENTNEFYLLDNDSISSITNDKNLKYTNILNGLFYDRVVLCEDESDCKFYSTLLESLNSEVSQNTLFCAVGGKDQFKLIIPLLKKLNINYFILADIDLINDTDKLKQLVNSIGDNEYNLINESHKKFLDEFKNHMYDTVKRQSTVKEEILECFDDEKYMSDENIKKIFSIMKEISKFKIFKSGGEGILPAGDCSTCYKEVKQFLIDRNIFILPYGEVERFCIEIDAHGDAFVNWLFQKYPDMDNPIYDKAKMFLKNVFKI